MFTIRPNGVPIQVQLRGQILRAIGTRRLRPGDRLATMRQVAVDLKINLDAVQRAFVSLGNKGVLVTVRGRGSFVSDSPPALDPAVRRAVTEVPAYRISAEARSRGLDLLELAKAIMSCAAAEPPESREHP
jgi:GntR family transcriptional regulator